MYYPISCFQQSYTHMKILVVFVGILFLTQASIFDQYTEQCKKIAASMTLEQKLGQMIQLNVEGITQKEQTNPQQAVDLHLGSLLIAGNAAPTTDGNMAKLYSYLEEQKNVQAYLKATAENWKKMTDRFKDLGVSVTTKEGKKYLIKLLFGTDAVHGDQHSVGGIIFPHNIGLSCTHNEANFENLGYWTKVGVFKSGFNYAFAPCVATSHNPQWGRYYESLGQESQYIYKYAKSFTKGLQDVANGKIRGVLGSSKHFFADGATQYGANEGSATVLNYKNFVTHNTQGYLGAISEEIGSVMVSYSAINFIPNSFNSYFLQGLLRDDLGFGGFTISDYDDISRAEYMQLPRTMMNLTSQSNGIIMLVNAGVDMLMLSGTNILLQKQIQRILKEAKKAVTQNLIFEERLEEAVTRILAVKMAMGLITSSNSQEKKQPEQSPPPQTSSGNQYQDSLTAIHQSLVLLKNDNILPVTSLKSDIKYVVLIGETILNINRLNKNTLFRNFDNIGMQCGGWSVRWQGFEGNDFWSGDNKVSSNASSILDVLTEIQKQNNFTLVYPNYTTNSSVVNIDVERRQFINNLGNVKKNMTPENTIMLGVFGEVPYAQSEGDVNIKYCKIQDNPACLYDIFLNAYVPGIQSKDLTLGFSNFEKQIITSIKSQNKAIPLVSVLLTGRPLPIPDIYEESSAVLAAWLPGTSGGQGIMDAITGDYLVRGDGESSRKNTLSMDWPKSMSGLGDFPVYGSDGEIPQIPDIQFKVGYGLSTKKSQQKQLLIE